LAAAALCAAGLGWCAWRAAAAADSPPKNAEGTSQDWSKFYYQNSAECANCHTQPTQQRIEQGALDLVLLTEMAIWRTHDKHAQAYAVLEGERGKKMAEVLGISHEELLKPETGCLNCHGMYNLSKANESRPGGKGKGLDLEDGVSCGGCHGPSSGWLGPHANKDEWRGKTAAEKATLGLRDLRDPERRAEVCTSCHVGSPAEGKVVTHAMYAAGHPPLPSFEIVSFSRNAPQHWRNPTDVPYFKTDKREVVEDYHLKDKQFLQVKFALVGAVVSVRQTMRLSHDRADPNPANPASAWPEFVVGEGKLRTVKPEELKAEFPERWPELAMAHSDCFACHHDLKLPGFRQVRGFGYFVPGSAVIRVSPGRPVLRSWPLAPLAAVCKFTGKKERLEQLQGFLKELAAACDRQTFGKPDDVRRATGNLIGWCDAVVADLREASYTKDSVRQLIVDLCDSCKVREGGRGQPGYAPDYETARLTASVVRAAYGDLAAAAGPEWAANDGKARALLGEFVPLLNLEPYTGRKARLAVVLKMIEGSRARKDNRFGEDVAKFQDYLKDIGNEKALKELVDNDFLTYLARNYTTGMFRKGLLQPQVVDQLQQIGDKEERETLDAVSAYDPAKVQQITQALADLLRQR
jgi:hypothetical protein